jgi:hypothetical protein
MRFWSKGDERTVEVKHNDSATGMLDTPTDRIEVSTNIHRHDRYARLVSALMSSADQR